MTTTWWATLRPTLPLTPRQSLQLLAVSTSSPALNLHSKRNEVSCQEVDVWRHTLPFDLQNVSCMYAAMGKPASHK